MVALLLILLTIFFEATIISPEDCFLGTIVYSMEPLLIAILEAFFLTFVKVSRTPFAWLI